MSRSGLIETSLNVSLRAHALLSRHRLRCTPDDAHQRQISTVWRQRLWEQTGDLRCGGFLAHRDPEPYAIHRGYRRFIRRINCHNSGVAENFFNLLKR